MLEEFNLENDDISLDTIKNYTNSKKIILESIFNEHCNFRGRQLVKIIKDKIKGMFLVAVMNNENSLFFYTRKSPDNNDSFKRAANHSCVYNVDFSESLFCEALYSKVFKEYISELENKGFIIEAIYDKNPLWDKISQNLSVHFALNGGVKFFSALPTSYYYVKISFPEELLDT